MRCKVEMYIISTNSERLGILHFLVDKVVYIKK